MSERFMTLKGDPSNNRLLLNMANQLWHLEKKLGIADSETITGGFYRRKEK